MMYNPLRGGVRGGADQFTWESVKSDKHRENYLGHSLMAPVGRWQKGKDLSWYAKQRKDAEASESVDSSEFASIKKAEEEAMLIALGHNIVRKNQTLTKEDMREALKRNTERDDHHIERIDGVGAASQRIASLSGIRKSAKQNDEGVAFETIRERNVSEINNESRSESMIEEKKKNKKKSKKHKKEKKHKKHHKESPEPDSSDDSSKYKAKHRKSKLDDANKSKSSYAKYHSNSDSLNSADEKSSKRQTHKMSKSKGRDFADSGSSDNDEERKFVKMKSHKKSKMRHQEYSSDSDSPVRVVRHKTKHKKRQSDSDSKKSSKEKSHKKSKHKDYSSDNSEERHRKRHKKQKETVKRRRHDTDSD